LCEIDGREIVRQDFDPLLALDYAIAIENVEHPDRSKIGTGVKTMAKPLRR
jgi:hypothetical protein